MFPRKNRLVVLTYHRVLSRPEVASTADIDADQFDMHVKTLDRYFNVLSLRDAVSLLDQRRLPARSVCITFDDGYKDNVTRALPILEGHGVPATFFIATGYLDGGVMWNDVIIEAAKQSPRTDVDLEELGFGNHALTSDTERQQLIAALLPAIKYLDTKTRDTLAAGIAERLEFVPPTDLMMASDDLQVLHRAGMEVGGHTQRHPILAAVDDEVARREILDGKRDIEALLGAPITSFAYPNGRPGTDYYARHAQLVREAGFERAVTTAPGTINASDDRFQLGRFGVWHRSPAKLILRVLANFFEAPAEQLAADVM